MKKITLCLALLVLVFSSWGIANVSDLRVRHYGNNATRLVMELDSKAYYSIESSKSGNILEINLLETALNTELPVLGTGYIVSDLRFSQTSTSSILILAASKPISHLSMVLYSPYRIVVDIFTQSPTGMQERLDLIDFFAHTGRLERAESMLANLQKSYPRDDAITLKWGSILLEAKDLERAKQKLNQIPSSSTHYETARAMLENNGTAKPKGSTFAPDSTQVVVKELPPVQEDPSPGRASSSEPVNRPKPRIDFGAAVAKYLPLIKIAGFILMALLIALVLIRSKIFKRKGSKSQEDSFSVRGEDQAEKENPLLDSDTLTRMVNRLANDGWKPGEIGLELGISAKEVKRLMHSKDGGDSV